MNRQNFTASVLIVLGILLLLLIPARVVNLGPLGNMEFLHYLSDVDYYGGVKSGEMMQYIMYLFVFTSVFSFPLICSMYRANAYATHIGVSPKLLWKMPVYSLLPTLGVTIITLLWIRLIVHPEGEAGMIYFYAPVIFFFYSIFYGLMSFATATFLYSRNWGVKAMGIIIILAMVWFFVGDMLAYVIEHGMEYGYPR